MKRRNGEKADCTKDQNEIWMSVNNFYVLPKTMFHVT